MSILFLCHDVFTWLPWKRHLQKKEGKIRGAVCPHLPGTGQPLGKSELSGKDKGPQVTHRHPLLCSMHGARALTPAAPRVAGSCLETRLPPISFLPEIADLALLPTLEGNWPTFPSTAGFCLCSILT